MNTTIISLADAIKESYPQRARFATPEEHRAAMLQWYETRDLIADSLTRQQPNRFNRIRFFALSYPD